MKEDSTKASGHAASSITKVGCLLLIGSTLALAVQGQTMQTGPSTSSAASPRFAWVDVYLDSSDKALAAYQFEFQARRADVKIVGIEGGEHSAFKEPPCYDPRALNQDRVIIAAFNTGSELPVGRTRVARLNLRIVGTQPSYSAIVTAAASSDGRRIPATVTVVQGDGT